MLDNREEKNGDPVMLRVMAERTQNHETREHLFVEIEEIIKSPLVSFFTSFNYPVGLADSDVDMFEGFLQTMDLSQGLIVILSSPGGDGVAAERMINVCRNYSGTGDYSVIIPGKAKSAATMICFGASKMFMGPSSELGPVDPQIFQKDDREDYYRIAAFRVVETYKQLFKDAVTTQGHIEPYIQQLGRYDSSRISDYEAMIDLSKDISIRALKSGMMQGKSESEIENMIEIFLTPEDTKTHGRPIYGNMAEDCGLNIERIDSRTKLWDLELMKTIKTPTREQLSRIDEASKKLLEMEKMIGRHTRPSQTIKAPTAGQWIALSDLDSAERPFTVHDYEAALRKIIGSPKDLPDQERKET
jgi:ATP-dependent protease ClpP protease subunit